jgi:hypothetical protein
VQRKPAGLRSTAMIAGADWWYFVAGRKLTEARVVAFYRTHEATTLDRKPETLCALLADDFTSTGTVAIGGAHRTSSQNKTETRDAYRGMYEGSGSVGG